MSSTSPSTTKVSSTSPSTTQVNDATRWFMLCIGILGMVAIANLQYGWTLFVSPLAKQLNAERTAIQIAFTLFILLETWPNFLEAYFVDRFGPKVVVIIGGILVALAWYLNSIADSLTMLYIGGMIGGVGAGIVYGTASGSALKWFPDRRGLAAGLTAMGFGAGSALTVVPIMNQIAKSGYQSAFLTWGLIQGVVVVICGILLRAPKPGETPAAAPAARVQQAAEDSMPREMVSTPAFWLLYLMFTMAVTGGLMAVAQLAPMAIDFKVADVPVNLFGLTLAALPFALSLDRILNGITRPFFGWVSDHIGRENTMTIAFGLEGFAILLLVTFAHNPFLFVVLSGLTFFGWGEVYSLFPATCGDLFGKKFATTNYGLLYTAKGTASVFVPIGSALAAGKAFDFRADIMLLIGLLLLFFTTFLGPTVLGIARSRNARTVLFIVAAIFIVYGLVLTVTNVWTPFAAKFKLPNVGWFGVFAVAVVFDWASALLAQFVLKPLRMRYLAKHPAAVQVQAVPAAS
jgi:OFA family oxalate/formate antiporter-like MFS transporter